MSIYDCRDKSAYSLFKAESYYAQNRHILKWWVPAYDKLILDQISRLHWSWYWEIADEVVKVTPTEIIEDWKKKDPLCRKFAWYNVLMYFAASRGEQLGFTRYIRKPKWKECPLCQNQFVEDSLPYPLVLRLGIDGLDFCAPCLRDTVLSPGNDFAASEQILRYMQYLTNLIQRVPTQNFGTGVKDLFGMSTRERLSLLNLLKVKPSQRRVKEIYGSWLNALITAGVLENGTLQTSRGIHCIAKDGHVCLSLAEKTIDDLLYLSGVVHEKEPRYPNSNYRGDFKVDEIIIEYFGLTGNLEYDSKTKDKMVLCKQLGIDLIAIYPEDLVSLPKLEKKLSKVLVGKSKFE